MARIIVTLLTLVSVFVFVPSFANAEAAKQKPRTGLSVNQQKSLELNEQGVRAVNSKDFASAEKLFRSALDLDAGNTTAAYNLAGMYITNKKEDQAANLLSPIVSQNPEDPSLRVRLADAYFGLKDLDRALKHYEGTYQNFPNTPGLPAKLATVYTLKNDFKNAEKMYEIAVKQEPKNPQFFANLSSLYLTNGKAQEAVGAAKTALQFKPSAETYVTLGNAYQQLNDTKNSAIAYQRALDLGSKDPELKQYVAKMKKAS